jgi:hypothetical protein
VFSLESRRDAKEGINETLLPDHIALGQPPDLPFPNQMHRLVTIDRLQGPFRRPEPQTRRNPLLDKSVVLLNGLITNDKFCLIRVSQQKLRYSRRSRALTCQAAGSYEYPRVERQHRGGTNEATVANPSSVSTDHGCGAAVGPGLPTSPGVDPTERPGFRSTASISLPDRSGGER